VDVEVAVKIVLHVIPCVVDFLWGFYFSEEPDVVLHRFLDWNGGDGEVGDATASRPSWCVLFWLWAQRVPERLSEHREHEMILNEALWCLDEVLAFEKVFPVNDAVEVCGAFACPDLIDEVFENVQDVVGEWVVIIEGGRLICHLGTCSVNQLFFSTSLECSIKNRREIVAARSRMVQ